jgi:Nif-specific regulatory protein
VRELENCVESAVVIMDGDELLAEHLPLPERAAGQSEAPPPMDGSASMAPAPLDHSTTPSPPERARPARSRVRTLAEVEREHILAVLEHAQQNRSVAAKLLGIGRNTLARKLKELAGEE